MNLPCFDCANEDTAMPSSPPPTMPRADSPDNLKDDIMPIPLHHQRGTLNDFTENSDQDSLSSQTFIDMVFYFFEDILSPVLGNCKQSDQQDETVTTPMPHSASILGDQSDISPLPSPGSPSRVLHSTLTVPKDLLNVPSGGNKVKKLKSSVARVDSPVKMEVPPSPPQAKVAGEDLSSHFLSTIASGESVSPRMTASVPTPEENLAMDDDFDFLSSMMVTPAPSQHEIRDNAPVTPDSQEGYPRAELVMDWDDKLVMDWVEIDKQGIMVDECPRLPHRARTVPDVITKTVAAQIDLKPRSTLMDVQDRFSPSTKNPIVISNHDVTDQDVLCGRESRGSKHPGNVFYRKVVGKNRNMYQMFNKRRKKTDLSTSIVQDQVKGRFLTKHKNGKDYVVFTWDESKKKVSQSLRENPRRNK